ncbi:hypothetical protein COU74_03865 [Candidatus Peregrinibacteria bacterium CG10_big_fil_rev_8_21_14_0_10_36_19]|nr:MAG: hypothetical protein COU74_03865 [Candidatus Peregrinibacteria bacterium CG10_big_fil_rev_8_21_14_0_10_36_19]
MKKITYILATTILLTGCFGIGNAPITEAPLGYQIFENNELQITYPETWEVLTQENFNNQVPNSTIVSIRNKIKSDIFTANLNITSGQVKDMTANDLQKANIEKLKNSLLNFELTETTKKDNGNLIRFSGKKSANEAIINFAQLITTNQDMSYIVTTSHIPGEDESVVKDLDEMLDSFSLK